MGKDCRHLESANERKVTLMKNTLESTVRHKAIQRNCKVCEARASLSIGVLPQSQGLITRGGIMNMEFVGEGRSFQSVAVNVTLAVIPPQAENPPKDRRLIPQNG